MIMRRSQTVILILIITVALLAACTDATVRQGEPSASVAPQSSNPPDGNGSADGSPDTPARIVTIDFVIEALQNPDEWVVIDVRTPEEYNGESRLPNAYGSGRLKGAVNVDRELVHDAEGELLPPEELLKLYEFIGDKKAVVYCHGGVRSTAVWGILTDLGFDAYNYEGSWVDWSQAASVASGNPNGVVLSLTEEWTDNEGAI